MKWSETTSCFNQRPSAAVIVRRKGQVLSRTNYPDYLVHYGIKGQQWGIRRYQNEDGTLTEEGKLRYNEGTPESETWNKNEAKYLTDRELQRRNNRLNQERQYREALTSDSERQAQQVRNDVIKKVIVGTALSLAAVAMRGHWKQAASFIGKHGKNLLTKVRHALTKPRTMMALKRRPNQLTNLGDRYGHIKGTPSSVRAGRNAKMFNYRPKTVKKGNLPPRFGLPMNYWPGANVRRKVNG